MQICRAGLLAALSAAAVEHASAQPSDGAPAERVFVNGEVLTADADFRIAEALAVDGERLLAVGSNDAIMRLAGEGTETVDLQGRTVVPGLIDNHMHFVRATRDWYRHVRWDDVTSREEAFERVAERSRALPPEEWVVVIGGFSFDQFRDDDSVFTADELDGVLADRPLYIQESYRRGFANSAALAAAGLDDGGDPPAGALTDENGDLTGELDRSAMGRVADARPAVSDERWDESLQRTVRDMHAMGLTTVYDVGGNGVTPDYYDALTRAAGSDALTMRVFYSLNPGHGIGPSAEEIIDALRTHEPDLEGLELAQFGWGEATYPPMRGQRISEQDMERYEAIALTAAEHGWQMNEHSMRDEKIRAMLTVFERVDRQRPIGDLRWTIAHTNGISGASIERANALGLVYAVHSSARLSDPDAGRGDTPPPIRSIHESGGTWGLGSDATTVASPNPFHNIGWAVTGLSPAGKRNLEQTVSREAALTAYTRSNAYLLFREEHLGSLEAGKLADFAVLDRDYLGVPAERIKDLRAVMTVVGGETVYSEL